MQQSDQFAKSAWMLASVAVVVAALYLAKSVLAPLTLAVLLSFMLSPVCEWLERRRLGRIPSVLITAIVGFTILGAAGWTVVVQMTDLAPKVPGYQKNLAAKLHSANAQFSALLSQVTRTAEKMTENLSEPAHEPQGTDEWPFAVRVITPPMSPVQIFGGMFGTLLESLGSTGMVVILVVFFLIRRDDLRDRFIRLVGQGQVTQTTQMLEDASTRVSRYLSMQLLVNVTFGTAAGVGLYLIGVPNAVLWGILTTTLKFVPYLGAWIAALMPVGLSMAISTNWMAPSLTIGLFVVLEFVSGNVIEPWLYGKNTGVSAVAVLLAAVLWTWLWGVTGLLLATPLTVCLLVIGKHVPQLSFLDTLLGNEPVFEPKKRVYQRLVAGDREEATELFEENLELKRLIEVYDTVLIPVLVEAETNWHRGELSEERHLFILQSLKEMIQEQDERQRELNEKEIIQNTKEIVVDPTLSGDTSSPPNQCILCLPAHDTADEIAGTMLAQTLEIPGYMIESTPATTPSKDLVDLVEQRKPVVICISATPPSVVIRARNLCLRLRRRYPEVHLVVGLWDAPGELNKAKEQIGDSKTTHVVTTLADAHEQIRNLIKIQPVPCGT